MLLNLRNIKFHSLYRGPNVVISRHNSESNKKIAFDAFHSGDYIKATGYLTTLMKEQNSTDPSVLAALALCLCQIPAKASEAEALVKRACLIGNDATEFVLKQSHVLREIGKADQSVKLLSNLLKREPNNWEVHYQLGWALNRNWFRYSAGILHLNQAIELNPNYLDSYYWRGEGYYWLDTSPVKGDAFEWLELIENPGFDSSRKDFYLGLRSYHLKKYENALTHFNQAQIGWKLSTGSHDLDSWRGETYLAINDLDNAIVSFDKALSKNPVDALSLHGKGTAWQLQGKESEGQALLYKALEIDRLYFKLDYFREKVPIQKGV